MEKVLQRHTALGDLHNRIETLIQSGDIRRASQLGQPEAVSSSPLLIASGDVVQSREVSEDIDTTLEIPQVSGQVQTIIDNFGKRVGAKDMKTTARPSGAVDITIGITQGDEPSQVHMGYQPDGQRNRRWHMNNIYAPRSMVEETLRTLRKEGIIFQRTQHIQK